MDINLKSLSCEVYRSNEAFFRDRAKTISQQLLLSFIACASRLMVKTEDTPWLCHSVADLASASNLTVRTASRYLKEFEKLGVVERKRCASGGNVYLAVKITSILSEETTFIDARLEKISTDCLAEMSKELMLPVFVHSGYKPVY